MSSTSQQSSSSSGNAFARLWLARDLAILGEWILFVSFIAYLGQFTDSPRTIAILVAAQFAPALLLGPIIHRRVDASRASILGAVALLVRATILLSVFFIEREHGFEPVIAIALAAALPSPVAFTAFSALLGAVVSPDGRGQAARALHATSLLVAGIGPALGLVLFGVSGIKSAGIAAIAAAVVSAGLLMVTRVEPAQGGMKTTPLDLPPIFGVLPAGIAAAFRHPVLSQVAAIQILAGLLAGGLIVAETAYTVTGLLVSMDNVAVLLAGQGFGMAAGAFGYYRFGRDISLNTLVTSGLALMACGVFGVALSSTLPAGGALAAVLGLGMGLLTASLCERGPELLEAEGVEVGSNGVRMAVHVAILLSIAAAAGLCETISARFTLVTGGILLSTLALYAFGAVPAGMESGDTAGSGEPLT